MSEQQPDYSPFPRPWTSETMTQLADYAEAGPVLSAMERDLVEVVRLAAQTPEPEPDAMANLRAAVVEYLAYLHSEEPLNDAFKVIKSRIVTAACNVVAASASVSPAPPEEDKPLGAGLIGQAIPDVVETEPRPTAWAYEQVCKALAKRPSFNTVDLAIATAIGDSAPDAAVGAINLARDAVRTLYGLPPAPLPEQDQRTQMKEQWRLTVETRVLAAHGSLEVFATDTAQGEQQLRAFRANLETVGLRVLVASAPRGGERTE